MRRSEVAGTLRWIAGLALALLVLVRTGQVLLLGFAGVLLAIFFRSTADALARRLGIGPGWTLAGTLIAVLLGLGWGAWFLAPEVVAQSRQLLEQVPQTWGSLQDRLGGIFGDRLVERVSEQFGSPGKGTMRDLLANVFGAVSGTLGALGSALVILFTGLYLAVDPGTYRRGLVRLVPPRHRERASDVLDQMGEALLWWLIGKLISMSLVGVLTYLGLWLLDVPLALTLALIASALTFVPNFGPIVSAVPAVLFASSDGLAQAGWVVALYVAVQTVESYLVTPLIQQRTVSLPPALTLGAQIVAGVLAGAPGLALATPLTAAGLVLVREIYVKDTLEQPQRAPA